MGHQDGAVAIITSMVELAQEQSTFFRNHLAETGHRLLGIVNAKQIDNSLRHMALELMVTFSESNPGLVRKFPEFITNSVQAALSLILCVSDDLAWTSIRESEEEENPNLDCGEKAMDRIAVAIEGKKLTPIIAPFIDSCLPDHNWRFRFAGLLAISRVGEVLAVDVVASLLRNVVRFVGDQHPRVRYAAIDCIGQLSVDKSPDVQISLHEIVVPALLSPLTDAGNPR